MSDEGAAVYTHDPTGRPVIDVASLPTSVLGPRSPVWWGNTLLIVTESMSLLLLLVVYFYVRQNFSEWPPPNPNALPALFKPVPDLPLPTGEGLVMLASCALTAWVHRRARELDAKAVKIGLWSLLGACLAIIACRFLDFRGTHFRWNDNAYASAVWTILAIHLTYLLVAAGEILIMVLWVHHAGLDEHHAHDVQLTGIYWYWVVATWLLIYAVVYVSPRIM